MHLYILGLDEGEADFDPIQNPAGLRDELSEGSRYLDQACQLLELVNTQKGARLRHILEHDLLESESFHRLIPLLDLGRIVDLLQGIEDDVSKVADDRWQLRPGPAAAVLAKAPGLVDTYEDKEGRTVQTLSNTMNAVLALRQFLIDALVRGLEVAID
ncbi:MAG TPA: hypothetical protein VFZ09_36120 [Archangium sp.]|uniref:hypothetical protein n=1 Tax=Archangium sp. TaxID=1872627 RepID=UPI002E37A849|nr:hypothetical protein [Archangium sp.]HEX5751703.1 hypothetical protein [Archangium sp.]